MYYRQVRSVSNISRRHSVQCWFYRKVKVHTASPVHTFKPGYLVYPNNIHPPTSS